MEERRHTVDPGAESSAMPPPPAPPPLPPPLPPPSTRVRPPIRLFSFSGSAPTDLVVKSRVMARTVVTTFLSVWSWLVPFGASVTLAGSSTDLTS